MELVVPRMRFSSSGSRLRRAAGAGLGFRLLGRGRVAVRIDEEVSVIGASRGALLTRTDDGLATWTLDGSGVLGSFPSASIGDRGSRGRVATGSKTIGVRPGGSAPARIINPASLLDSSGTASAFGIDVSHTVGQGPDCSDLRGVYGRFTDIVARGDRYFMLGSSRGGMVLRRVLAGLDDAEPWRPFQASPKSGWSSQALDGSGWCFDELGTRLTPDVVLLGSPDGRTAVILDALSEEHVSFHQLEPVRLPDPDRCRLEGMVWVPGTALDRSDSRVVAVWRDANHVSHVWSVPLRGRPMPIHAAGDRSLRVRCVQPMQHDGRVVAAITSDAVRYHVNWAGAQLNLVVNGLPAISSTIDEGPEGLLARSNHHVFVEGPRLQGVIDLQATGVGGSARHVVGGVIDGPRVWLLSRREPAEVEVCCLAVEGAS